MSGANIKWQEPAFSFLGKSGFRIIFDIGAIVASLALFLIFNAVHDEHDFQVQLSLETESFDLNAHVRVLAIVTWALWLARAVMDATISITILIRNSTKQTENTFDKLLTIVGAITDPTTMTVVTNAAVEIINQPGTVNSVCSWVSRIYFGLVSFGRSTWYLLLHAVVVSYVFIAYMQVYEVDGSDTTYTLVLAIGVIAGLTEMLSRFSTITFMRSINEFSQTNTSKVVITMSYIAYATVTVFALVFWGLAVTTNKDDETYTGEKELGLTCDGHITRHEIGSILLTTVYTFEITKLVYFGVNVIMQLSWDLSSTLSENILEIMSLVESHIFPAMSFLAYLLTTMGVLHLLWDCGFTNATQPPSKELEDLAGGWIGFILGVGGVVIAVMAIIFIRMVIHLTSGETIGTDCCGKIKSFFFNGKDINFRGIGGVVGGDTAFRPLFPSSSTEFRAIKISPP
tara:strand:+ start:892 stop:2262 length:1371 start_codon:yes stop_codon:yes gene_type:complete